MAESALSQLLRERRDQIVTCFVSVVQQGNLPPPSVSRSLLVDHIPVFLDEIVAELSRRDELSFDRDTFDTSATARRHGEQRWHLGYDLEALIREYGILRHCIIDTAKQNSVAITLDEFDVVAKCLSVGVAEAAMEYIKYRDQQLDAQKAHLEFLVEAGEVLASSLDYRSTLSRLTGLLVPRMADWCAVHLEGDSSEEMVISHVDPSMVEVIQDIYRRFPGPADSPHGYSHVLRTAEPQLTSEAGPDLFERTASDEEHLSLLRQVGTRSWLILPLRVHGNIVGTLTLAHSSSGRRYDSSSLMLAGELARRAATAIDNARLYDLSQKERSRVEAATRAKDEFVATVSHELRTPLNAILGWVRLIRSGSLDESKKKHAFEVIERNAEAQNQLVADLLDISRVITGKIRINPSQLDLSNVVEMAVEGVRPAAEAKRVLLDLEIDRDNAVMRGDGERLQQVVWNLLTNAVKFTPKNGSVVVRLRRVESDIELTVEDTGDGIDPSFLPHVFESFRQSDGSPSRSHGGLGIGLSIVKHIVELHGGSIVARSAGKGAGATFVMRLPISPLVSTTLGVSRVAATQPPVSNAVLPAGGEGIRVLIVDDDPDARDLVTYVLEACGMEVVSAGDVAEAMGVLARYTPNVIVSDIGLPDDDGYFLIRNIRTHPAEEKRDIPAIALTAFARNEDRTKALVEGFNVHMAKPVAPTVLVRAVVDLASPVRR